jgi:hypothetical protein
MIRFPAIPAVILAISALTGCQVLQPPAEKTDSQEVSKPEPIASKTESQAMKPEKTEPQPSATIAIKQQLVQTPARLGGKLLLGFAEKGTLTEYGLTLDAKIDTGAERTSIDARNVENFERDGKKWVRFDLPRTSKGSVTLELPVKDTIQIKVPGEESQQRPIVKMNVKVGDITQNLDVSLNDRTDFEFPLLVGRDFLQDMAIADVGKKYIATEHVLETITRKVPAESHIKIKEQIDRPVDIQGLPLLGEIETVHVEGIKTPLKARIDTGAETSSIDARDIERFTKGGVEWVRFKVILKDETKSFELPVNENVLIKRHGGLENQRRAIVLMNVTIGKITKPAEFTLTDRTGYEFPVLIGEKFLSNTALVDVAQKNIAELTK